MHLERVLLADGQRIGLGEHLPAAAPLRATSPRRSIPTTSLYAAIRATGVEFGSAVERVETVLASPREAALLESTTAMPMLRLHRRSLDTDDRPIEVVRSLYRGDRVAFEALLNDRAPDGTPAARRVDRWPTFTPTWSAPPDSCPAA